MGISVIGAAASSGGGGGSNDFVLNVNGNTTYGLDRTYSSGRYSIELSDSDSTFDIYAITDKGLYAGYTNTAVLETSEDFAELVVIGVTSGVRIFFTHLGVLNTATTSGDVATAGAFINSVGTSSLPDVDDFTVVSGGNFASDVEVSFIDQNAVETAAKSVVRSSSTELLATRPDSFSPDDSPYTVKVVNPGIPVPAGTNAHLLSNAVTAGTNPVWTTGTDIYYNVGAATSITLLATDTEASDIDYSLISGTLPDGLTLDGETGVISGTATGSPAEGTVTAITIRAVDAGGNFLDKAFNLTANTAPTWTTAAGALDPAPAPDNAYNFQLVASTGSAGGVLTFTLQSGALLPGHTLSSTGLISGTSTGVIDDSATFTIRVTDEGGLFVDREFTTTIFLKATGGTITEAGGYVYHTFTGSGNFVSNEALSLDVLVVAGGGGAGTIYDIWSGGGGGGGGFQDPTFSTSAGYSYAITIGAGGGVAVNGSNSSAFGTTSIGGGSGGLTPDYSQSSYRNGASGGSGGGGARMTGGTTAGYGSGGSGTAGQGYAGGNSGVYSDGNAYGGGGGGAGSGGQAGTYQGIGGSPRAWYDSVGYARGGNGAPSYSVAGVPGAANSGDGGSRYASGGSGVVIVRYAA